jgi:hypothetical protein
MLGKNACLRSSSLTFSSQVGSSACIIFSLLCVRRFL